MSDALGWTVAHQAPLSMVFFKQEYWSGLPCLSPGELPDPGIEPQSPTLQADSLLSEPPGKPRFQNQSPADTKGQLSIKARGKQRS